MVPCRDFLSIILSEGLYWMQMKEKGAFSKLEKEYNF